MLRRVSISPFPARCPHFLPDVHGAVCYVVDFQIVACSVACPSAFFLPDVHGVVCYVIDYQVVACSIACPSAHLLSDGHTEYDVGNSQNSQKDVFTF